MVKSAKKRPAKKAKPILAWHFVPCRGLRTRQKWSEADKKWVPLPDAKPGPYYRYNMTYVPVEVGVPVEVKGGLKLCTNGLHASVKIKDACVYYSAWDSDEHYLCRVRCEGVGRMKPGVEKFVCRKRTPLWMILVTPNQIEKLKWGRLTVKGRKLVKVVKS